MKQAKKYHYQEPDTKMTLQQGLDEYYKENPGFVNSEGFLAQDNATVRAHDAGHVFFGLGCTSAEELLMETMTVFGCTISRQKMTYIIKKGFLKRVVQEFGIWRLFKRLVTTFPRVVRATFRACRMKKRWPHFEYEQFLSTPLGQLREDFGIKVQL
jgi:hypothetical protein